MFFHGYWKDLFPSDLKINSIFIFHININSLKGKGGLNGLFGLWLSAGPGHIDLQPIGFTKEWYEITQDEMHLQ